MYTNVNLAAPVGALAFLGTAFLLFVVGLALIYSLVRKRFGLTKLALLTIALIAVLYLTVLLIFSFRSSEKVLARGLEKHFCEIDCHLAYAVVGEKAETLREGRVRHTVTVRVRFDEETISARRSRAATLTPNSRYVALVDAEGHQYPGSTDGLKRPLIPGESYTTDLVFDVPADARDLRLVLRNNDAETAFIIGHENSLLHGKTTFSLTKVS